MQTTSPPATQPTLKLLTRLATDIPVLLLFYMLAVSSYHSVVRTGSLLSLSLLVFNGILIALFVSRRETRSISAEPLAWVLGFAGTTAPLLLRPAEAALSLLPAIGLALQVVGLVLLFPAILSLRRSFGIVAANRGIQTGGMYRVVRHPLYTAELCFMLGFVLVNPSLLNAGVWLAVLGLQLARIHFEEGVLGQEESYRAYRRQVRYRLCPGIY